MNISINSYKNIQQSYLRQVKLFNKTPICLSLEKAREYFSLPRKGKRYLKVKERFIQYLIDQSIKYEVVYGFQEKIAEYIDCDDRHLRKVIRELRKQQWITVIGTAGMCNIYILNPIFQERSFCIGMTYIWNNLLVDKEIYQAMYASKHFNEQKDKPDIKSHQFHETVCDDERFRPAITDRIALDKIFGSSKMPSIFKDEYTHIQATQVESLDSVLGMETLARDFKKTMGEISSPLDSEGEIENPQTGMTTMLLKKEQLLMQDLYEELLPITTGLQSIRLTFWGQIRLSCFPDEAILYADQELFRVATPPQDPFKYFRAICERWCKENQIPGDWKRMIHLGQTHKMPNDGPFYDPSFIPVKPIVKKTQAKARAQVYPFQHNQAIVMEYAPHLANQPKPLSILEEYEYMKKNNPEAIVHWDNNAKVYRRQLGLNEDGTFLPGRSPHEAISTLLKGVSPIEVQLPNKNQTCAREIEQKNGNTHTNTGYFDGFDLHNDMDYGVPIDYSSDPFGDRI